MAQNFHFHSRFTLLGHGDLDACLRDESIAHLEHGVFAINLVG